MKKLKQSNLSKWINHSVKKELYGNSTRKSAIALLTTLSLQIKILIEKSRFISTKKKYQEVLVEVEKLLKMYKYDYTDLLTSQITDIVETESEWVKDFMKGIGKTIVIPASIVSTIRFSPVAAQTNFTELVNSSVDRIYKNVNITLKNALISGGQPNVEHISTELDKEVHRVDSSVETFNTTAFSVTDYLIFKANKEKVIYSAILDSKTCLSCSSYDGQEFSLADAPIPPLHERCRCTLIPVSVADEKYSSYKDWFESQSDAEKKIILGKGRYELYKSGIPIETFSNNGQIVPLSQLQMPQ